VRRVLVALAALALAGCGAENADDAAVRQVVTDYLAAFAGGDGAKACALMLPEVQRSLGDCPAKLNDAFKRLTKDELMESQALQVDTVTAAGDNARARLTPGDSQVALRKVGGRWRIAGVPG
jgi:ABC-type glycerol-3-phosphate transport system substrate-binding protein